MKLQKRLAAAVMKSSVHRVIFNENELPKIREAITKFDIKRLVKQGIITERPTQNTSKYHSRLLQKQKAKGRHRGFGSRKGRANARFNEKDAWISRIRVQRKLLFALKDKKFIDKKQFRDLYLKAKGGFFRSVNHVKLYAREQGIIK